MNESFIYIQKQSLPSNHSIFLSLQRLIVAVKQMVRWRLLNIRNFLSVINLAVTQLYVWRESLLICLSRLLVDKVAAALKF